MGAGVHLYRWLLVPPVAFLLVTIGFAVISFTATSFYPGIGMGLTGDDFTLKNYQRLLDFYYLEVLGKTILVSAITTTASAVMSYPIAWCIIKKSGWSMICFVVILASSAMSLVVRALGWIGILTDGGPVSAVRAILGIANGPLHILGTELAVIVGLVHGFIPLFVLTLMPVLAAIDPDLELAAAGLGASEWTIFRKVIIPLSLPGAIAASLVVFAMCMGAYTTPALLSGGRALTFPILIQQQIMTLMNYPMGATLALVLLALVLCIIWTGTWLARSAAYGAPAR